MARLSVGSRPNDKRELSRKELLKNDDAFLNAASDGAAWAERNKSTLLIAGGLLFLGVAGVIAYDAIAESRGKDGAEALAHATDVMAGSIVTGDEKADPTAASPTFATEKDRDQAAREAFAKVRDGSSGKSAQLARLMIANLDVKLADKEAAEKELSVLAGEMGEGDSLYWVVVERLAYLQEGRGDLDSAIKTLERLKEKAFYADRAALHIARLEIAKGDTAKARVQLEKIKKDYDKSAVATEAGELLTSLGGAAPAKAE